MPVEIMTVLGPIASDQLGIVLPHEHLLCDLARVTGLPEHHLGDLNLAVIEAARFRAAGGNTIVDVTSRELGRNPAALQAVALATGLHIIMGCGWYREPFFTNDVYRQSTNELAADIVRDITTGVDDTGIRAGIIGEVGSDRDYVSPAEERCFRAAARAHRETGLSITTHAVRSPVGLDQLDILVEEGVEPGRIIVGHCDSLPDPDYHEALAKRGAWVEFDLQKGRFEWDVETELRLIQEFVHRGYIHRLLLSHDVCMKTHLQAYGGKGYDYIPGEFTTRLVESGISKEQIQILLIENPRAALTGAAI